jgi:HAD superfamily hydrolase (TIGR01509 family)
LAEAGVQVDQEEFHRRTSGLKNQEILKMMLGNQLSDEEINYWTLRKEGRYRDRFSCCIEPVPGLIELLEQATKLGIKLAVASAAPPDNLTFILDGLEIRGYFKAVVGGEDVMHGKPAPDIFLKAAAMLGVEPSNCLVFEDALGGIEAARRAEMDVFAILTTLHRHEVTGTANLISAGPDFTHFDLLAVAG